MRSAGMWLWCVMVGLVGVGTGRASDAQGCHKLPTGPVIAADVELVMELLVD